MWWALLGVLVALVVLGWLTERRRRYQKRKLAKVPPQLPARDPGAPPIHYNCRSVVVPLQLPQLPSLPLPKLPSLPSMVMNLPPGISSEAAIEAMARLVLGELADLEFITWLDPPQDAEAWRLPFVARRVAPEVPYLLARAEILLAGAGDEEDDNRVRFTLYAKKHRARCTSAPSGGMYEPAKEQDQ